ncbi:hypothetical protein AWRI1631_153370 [Saccharomyces cerevisiae AWRI1631]|uniref:Uncharacterized protein n=1 Tax=Saccharomyces cerevisiae (strain AWRI1631) TaxID=545124 RepID=B5VS70_YEAS6|nr:hypothetical protein AWRI1631_153370 [Saccharomyces cerevisiae AWRI1631]
MVKQWLGPFLAGIGALVARQLAPQVGPMQETQQTPIVGYRQVF